MGGAVNGRGNTHLVPAEFNIGFDPEAAHVVFSNWPTFDLVDWEATMHHGLAYDDLEQWLAAAGRDEAEVKQGLQQRIPEYRPATH